MRIFSVNYNNGINNISFATRRKVPVCAIDKNNECLEFESLQEASKQLGVVVSSISMCINKKQKTSKGYVFVKGSNPDDAQYNYDEIISSIGIKDIDQEIKGFYVVDKDGNYEKFYFQKDAAQYLGVAQAAISDCLLGRYNIVKGNTIIPASCVESINDEGEVVLDKVKLQNIAHLKNNHEVYSVDIHGNYEKHDSMAAAAKKFGILRGNILYRTDAQKPGLVNGHAFIKANDVEYVDDEGKIVLDVKKLLTLALAKDFHSVYLVDKNGEYKKYLSSAEAADAIYCTRQLICSCLKGKNNHAAGYTVVKASDVEFINDNGEIELKKELLCPPIVKRHRT